MFSDLGLFNAIFLVVTHFFIEGILGIFYMFQGIKTKTKLLFFFGLGVFGISISLGLSNFIDFVTILITGNNMNGYLKLYITWTPSAFIAVFLGYVFIEVLLPKKKWYFLSIILILNTFYLLDLLIFDWTTDIIVYPAIPGEALIITHHALPNQPFPFRWSGFSNSYGMMFGVGLIYKGLGTNGIFRKKYFYLSATTILFNSSQLFSYELTQYFGYNAQLLFMIIGVTYMVTGYLGLRAEPEQRKKRVKKKVIAKDSLFRIIERPEQITEEEVAYYKEQKICLMCRGKVTGFNIFICPNCDTLYHEDCAHALSKLENACWVCNEPIDNTIPTKPFEKVEKKKLGVIFGKEEKDSKANINNFQKKEVK